MELVLRCHKRQAGFLRDLRRGQGVKARRRVQPGPDGRAAQGQCQQGLFRHPQQLLVFFQAGAPSGDFLAEQNRRRVLQVGASAFEHVRVFLLQPDQFLLQPRQGADRPLHGFCRGNMHCRRESVVGGLAHIHVIVGVQQLFSRDLIAPVRDDFVHVHVALGSGSGLPYHQRKMIVQLPVKDFIRGPADCFAFLFGHLLRFQLPVGQRRRHFQHGKRPDDFLRHVFMPRADREIIPAPFRLGSPVPVCRNSDFAHGIMLCSVCHRCHILRVSDVLAIIPKNSTRFNKKQQADRLLPVPFLYEIHSSALNVDMPEENQPHTPSTQI